REAVVVHRAAGILEPHEHDVVLRRDAEHGGDLVAQRLARARAQIALEVEHEDAAALPAVAPLLLAGLRAPLEQLLEAILAVHGAPHHVGPLLELAVQVTDLEAVGVSAAPAHADE